MVSSPTFDEPRLFCEHLEQWRSARVDTHYDAGASLFRSADFSGVGVVGSTILRTSLKSSKWCVLSQSELEDLMDLVGVRNEVTQEEFCEAFCKFIQWAMRPKPCKTPGAVVQSTQRRYSTASSISPHVPTGSSRPTTFRRHTNEGKATVSAPSSLRAFPRTSSPTGTRPSSPTSLPPVQRSARSVDRLPVFLTDTRSKQSSLDSVWSGPSISRCSTASYPSGTSSTRDLIRDKYGTRSSHFVGGAAALNFRSSSTAFRARLVTSQAMRDYHNIFKGINVSNNGTVSIQEFEKHMARVAPELLPNAQRMYNAACKKGASKGKCDSELDFQSLLSVLFPSATKRDVKELVQMTINRKPNKQAGPTAEQLHDAGTVFKFWNKTGDGLLTYQEMENGLEGLRMTEEDVDEWLEDVFGRDGGPDARNCVNLAEFTAWFTSHPGGKLCRL